MMCVYLYPVLVSACLPMSMTSLRQVQDIALHKLQTAGMQLIEWDILLYSRMNVPRSLGDSSPLF
jgi:hypothetical protein